MTEHFIYGRPLALLIKYHAIDQLLRALAVTTSGRSVHSEELLSDSAQTPDISWQTMGNTIFDLRGEASRRNAQMLLDTVVILFEAVGKVEAHQ